MEHAGRVGIDANGFTWEAVRRAKAAQNGEAFNEDQTIRDCERVLTHHPATPDFCRP